MSGLQTTPSSASLQLEEDEFDAMLAEIKADFRREHGREPVDEEAFDLLVSRSPRDVGASRAASSSAAVAGCGDISAMPSTFPSMSHNVASGLDSDGNESDASDRSYTARLRNPENAYFQVNVTDLESRVAGLLKESAGPFNSPLNPPKDGSPRAEDVVTSHVRDVFADHHGRAATSEEVGSALMHLLPAIAAAKSEETVRLMCICGVPCSLVAFGRRSSRCFATITFPQRQGRQEQLREEKERVHAKVPGTWQEKAFLASSCQMCGPHWSP